MRMDRLQVHLVSLLLTIRSIIGPHTPILMEIPKLITISKSILIPEPIPYPKPS